MMLVTVTKISSVAEFENYKEEWDSFIEEEHRFLGEQFPYYYLLFTRYLLLYCNYYFTFFPDRKMHFLMLRKGKCVVALLPLQVYEKKLGFVRVKLMRFIGEYGFGMPLDLMWTRREGLMSAQEMEIFLSEHLEQEKIAMLVLAPILKDSPYMLFLQEKNLLDRCHYRHQYRSLKHYFIPNRLYENYEALSLAEFSQSVRRRYRKAMDYKREGAHVRLEIFNHDREKDYERLFADLLKQSQDTNKAELSSNGVDADTAEATMLYQMIKELYPRGEATLLFNYYNEQLAAIMLAFHPKTQGRLFAYYVSANRESSGGTGTLLFYKLCEYAYNQGYEYTDFMTGWDYLQRFTSKFQKSEELVFIRKNILGTLIYILLEAKKYWKKGEYRLEQKF
ncbi:MAG: GNAT family N-acetyltransferase [Oligoflexia bacterium]|nr:GNAT family N-acetyltransferase [Oligoflexia bacterium]MBF0365682.1 GNAT family N-acetyltransferase [Oligoflexia bacterium]